LALSGSVAQPPQAPRDPVLQAERTALAWSRTGLALLVNALLALRLGLTGVQSPLMLTLGGALLGSAAAVMWLSRRRRRALVGDARIGGPPVWMVRVTLVAALGAAATGLTGVVLGMR
jgi:LPXTG-motif cell wall-anchored protein